MPLVRVDTVLLQGLEGGGLGEGLEQEMTTGERKNLESQPDSNKERGTNNKDKPVRELDPGVLLAAPVWCPVAGLGSWGPAR